MIGECSRPARDKALQCDGATPAPRGAEFAAGCQGAPDAAVDAVGTDHDLRPPALAVVRPCFAAVRIERDNRSTGIKSGAGRNGLPEPERVIGRAVHYVERIIQPAGERVPAAIGNGISPGFEAGQTGGLERLQAGLKNAFKAPDGLPGE
ncbi:MAG: hypothetical protein MUC57_17050 [Desulfobacterales bacterium]|nr:hypothetical protein [Desulfobacterales bacterium]